MRRYLLAIVLLGAAAGVATLIRPSAEAEAVAPADETIVEAQTPAPPQQTSKVAEEDASAGLGKETRLLMMSVTPRIIIQEEEEEQMGISPSTP